MSGGRIHPRNPGQTYTVRMTTAPETMAFLLDQLEPLAHVTHRRMFGEYALYVEGKVVAFVCDDTLFLKPTEPGDARLRADGRFDAAPAYPGSKLYRRISADLWEDRDWLTELVRLTAAVLPEPKPRVSRTKRGAAGSASK